MASTKISQLNQATGYTLNDVIAVVDSGFTETKKIDIRDLFSVIGSTNTNENNNDLILASTSSELLDRSVAGNTGSTGNNVIMSSHNVALRSDDGLGNNTILSTDQGTIDIGTEGGMNIIGSSYNNPQITRAFGGTILSSTGGEIRNGNERAAMIAGNNSIIQGTYTSGIFASSSCELDNLTEGAIISSRNSRISARGTNQVLILNSDNSNLTHDDGTSTYNAIINNVSSNLNTLGTQNIAINNFGTSLISTGGGKLSNLMLTNNYQCTITPTNAAEEYQIKIDNSYLSQVSGNIGDNIWMANTVSTNVSGGTGVAMLSTDGRSQEFDWTTHSDNVHVFETLTRSVYNGGNVSGSITVDLSSGSFYTFAITGNLTNVQFDNWREGGEYEFFVENTGSYTISAMSITGGGSVYVKGGSINPTNNGFTKYHGIVMNGNMLLNEELDFQAI